MSLDYEILRNEYMGISGSSLLRVIQNNDIPILDLLTREVVQNSLDAALDNVDFVKVDINNGRFNIEKMNSFIEPFGTKLVEKYKDEQIDSFISFRDTNTTGLIGPANMNEVINNDYGKFINLVFNVGKPQTIEDAGGSWGYGKTVYYRVGKGVVIFYSRIKENEKFISRLIVSFVEDENDTIIPSYNNENRPKTGIMWFGKKIDESLFPITDEDLINEILEIFNIQPFKEEETGTTIIIPYINEEMLLKDVKREEEYLAWGDNIEKYINVAIQRWYAPRLMNTSFRNNPYLFLSINGEIFNKESDFLPLFKTLQELYNYSNMNAKDLIDETINIETIKLKETFENGEDAGKVIFKRLKKEDLRIIEPYNEPTLGIQIDNTKYDEDDIGYPIITFCRKPGMILKYDIYESWSNSIRVEEDEYILGLFIANSKNSLRARKNTEEEYSFEKYLRDCEKADHADWIDLAGYKIIQKIQYHIKNKINNKYLVENEKRDWLNTDTKLSRKLTMSLLPPIGFGKRPSALSYENKGSIVERKLTSTKKTNLIMVEDSTYRDGSKISKDVIINFGKDELEVYYEFDVLSEESNFSGSDWEKLFANKPFPLDLLKIELLTKGVNQEEVEYFLNKKLSKTIDKYEDEYMIVEKIKTKRNTWVGWKIKLKNDSAIRFLLARITYEYNDMDYICTISKGEKDIINE